MIYFAIISASLCLSVLWLTRRADAVGFKRQRAIDLALSVMIAGFIGSRLFHVIFEEPNYYAESPWRVFEIWRGGFVWYGGALIGALAGVLYLRRHLEPLGRWLDLVAPICALGYGLGRLACWITGCCFGSVCELNLPGQISPWRFQHPTQLYAVFWEALVLALLLFIEKKRHKPELRILRPSGRLFSAWVIFHSIGRIIMEYFRADPRGPTPLELSLGTWISTAALLAAFSFEMRRSIKSNKNG